MKTLYDTTLFIFYIISIIYRMLDALCKCAKSNNRVILKCAKLCKLLSYSFYNIPLKINNLYLVLIIVKKSHTLQIFFSTRDYYLLFQSKCTLSSQILCIYLYVVLYLINSSSIYSFGRFSPKNALTLFPEVKTLEEFIFFFARSKMSFHLACHLQK